MPVFMEPPDGPSEESPEMPTGLAPGRLHDRPAPLGMRSIAELRDSGLLWLINRVVFHPRGYALTLWSDDDGRIGGWTLEGDGSEAWSMPEEIDDAMFDRVKATFASIPGPTVGVGRDTLALVLRVADEIEDRSDAEDAALARVRWLLAQGCPICEGVGWVDGIGDCPCQAPPS